MTNFRCLKYIVSGAKYSCGNILLAEFIIHRDFESTIGPGVIRNRSWLLSQLLNGSSFYIGIKNNDQWDKEGKVILNYVAGRLYINTRPELHPGDNLGYEITKIYNYITRSVNRLH